jgi:hypothetical protein
MASEPAATDSPSHRKRDTWSIRRIAQDIASDSMGNPRGGYLGPAAGSGSNGGGPAGMDGRETADEVDPVVRFSPPLVGPVARASHDPRHEHHSETIEHLNRNPPVVGPGMPSHPPGPSRRPERIYLHYLLLHLDRLSDAALSYLSLAVFEELAHRKERRPAARSEAQPESVHALSPPPMPPPVPPAAAPG